MQRTTVFKLAVLAGSCAIPVLIPGCSSPPATHTERVDLIREEWQRVNEAINEWRREAIADCNGNQDCINQVIDKYDQMRTILLNWRLDAISGELASERQREQQWDEFIQSLPPKLRDLADVIIKLIDLIRPSRISMLGTLTASGQLAITLPNGGSADTDLQGDEPLSVEDAVSAGLSVIQAPIGIVPIHRTVLSGIVGTSIEVGEVSYSSQTDIFLAIRWDGAFDPGDQFAVESGRLLLFDGAAQVRFDVDSSVGSSYGRIWPNGHGEIMVSGRVSFNDPLSNTIMFGDKRVLLLPISRVSPNQVRVDTDGFVSTSFLKPFTPRSISDFDRNGVVDAQDETAFLSAFASQDAWSDINGDGVHDSTDLDMFYVRFDADLAHQNWLNDRRAW